MTKIPEAVSRAAVFTDVSRERDRQDRIHGEKSIVSCSAIMGFPILMEECGEVAKAYLDKRPDDFRKELVEVAAVAVAMIQAHDAREHARMGA